MEILLAIVVASAVIFFGALISLGNERQRKAIDAFCEQVTLWAIQDIKIKREHLAYDVDVPDPLDWLNYVASRVSSNNLDLQVLDVFSSPQVLLCSSGIDDLKVAFSPLSPKDILTMNRNKQNRLSQFSRLNPLFSLPRGTKVYELSMLNDDLLFDLKASIAWNKLTSQELTSITRLWMYEYP